MTTMTGAKPSLQEQVNASSTLGNVLQWELDDLTSRWNNLTEAADYLAGLNPETLQAARQARHHAFQELDTIDNQFLSRQQIKNLVHHAINPGPHQPVCPPLLRIRNDQLVTNLETMLDDLEKARETAPNDDFRLTEEWAAIMETAAEAAAYSRAASQ